MSFAASIERHVRCPRIERFSRNGWHGLAPGPRGISLMPTGPEHPNPLPTAGGPQEAENRPAPVPSPAEAISNLVQCAVPNGSADPSDDSPTIISKSPRRPARPEEAITSTLRGRRLAHFELRDAIGVGGMAAVIRAQDTKLERTVALKILPPDMAADPENIRRFHQEARAAASLDHENIARVFYCGDDQGLHFIAFEYVEGENLRTILERRGRLSVSEAIHYMLQIA